MSRAGLAGLPQFMRVLSTLPAPPTMMRALVTGPLGGHGLRTCRVWALNGDDLVSVVGHGHTPEEDDRYSLLPGAIDLVVWRAVRSGRPVVSTRGDGLDTEFGAVDEDFWTRFLARVSAQSIVRAPIRLGGISIGAIGFVVDRPWPMDSTPLLDAVTGALALWMANPESGAHAAAAATRTRVGRAHLALSDRQRQVLRLVIEGWSTPAIAIKLHQSESTIKADLGAAMRAVRSGDRLEAAHRADALGLL